MCVTRVWAQKYFLNKKEILSFKVICELWSPYIKSCYREEWPWSCYRYSLNTFTDVECQKTLTILTGFWGGGVNLSAPCTGRCSRTTLCKIMQLFPSTECKCTNSRKKIFLSVCIWRHLCSQRRSDWKEMKQSLLFSS